MSEIQNTNVISDNDKLQIKYKLKLDEITSHKIQLEKLEQELYNIRKDIIQHCTHEWIFESPAIYEKGYYYCKHCGIPK
tara:strand:- start:16243 stop:16479 length:237 start_codon:yes stop_codon:yes gene_type:complete